MPATSCQALLITYGPERGEFRANVDSVLARCGGIYSKADYALPPIGLLSCATYLENLTSPVPCEVVDLSAEGLHGRRALERLEPLGGRFQISSPATSTLGRDLAFSRAWQEEQPGRWLVFNGTHATAEPQSLLEQDRTAVVRGEPEVTTGLLARAILDGGPLDDIPGVSFRDQGDVRHNPPAESLPDLADLPIPDRRWIKHLTYAPPFARPGPFQLVVTARGCPFACRFCASQSYYGRRVRYRPVEQVLAEVRELALALGVRNLGFWDDTFTLDRKRVMDICQGIRDIPGKVEWICLARVDTVDPDLLAAMAAAGCYQIQYGVESGSERLLRLLGKNCTLEQVKNAFQWTRQAGIQSAGFFMLGIPGETPTEREQTIALAKALRPDYASFNICTPLPGSPLYADLRERFQAGGAEQWADMSARVPGGWLEDPAERRDLQRAVRRAYRQFYFQSGFVMHQLRQLRSWGQFRGLCKAGWALLRNSG